MAVLKVHKGEGSRKKNPPWYIEVIVEFLPRGSEYENKNGHWWVTEGNATGTHRWEPFGVERLGGSGRSDR